jgi:type IV pilus assembly protein PilC
MTLPPRAGREDPMLLSERLSLKELSELSRALRHYLSAGLTLLDVFRQQAKRGRPRVRPVAARIAAALGKGQGLEETLQAESGVFPVLFISLMRVGERSGQLAEVSGELEKYYARQDALRRRFLAQITWPIIQFFLSVFIVAGLIWIMGLLAGRNPGEKPFDPLGLGLFGTTGALIFLGAVFGTLGTLLTLYVVARRNLYGRVVDEWLLRIPVLGSCLRALALARFSLAFGMTTDTNIPMASAIRLSMRATGNDAFAGASEAAEDAVRAGEEVTAALGRTRLFPEEYLHVLAVGEETGQLPEVMRRQAVEYDDEAGRRLKTLAATAAWGVWALVAILIIITIFRIYLSYISLLG